MEIDLYEERVGGFNYEFLRTVGSGAAEIGECLGAAKAIADGDSESWLTAFNELANRVRDRAAKYEAAGFAQTACQNYMRACNYHRTSVFYAESRDPRREDYWRIGRECFRTAMGLYSAPVRTISIPFGDARLPGYFFSGGDGNRPTLIAIGGYDSTAEEVVSWIAFAAQQHGWNCLVFEGPGQWGGLYDNPGLTMAHDWERPVAAAVDFVLTLPGVDAKRLALVGYSLGGNFAPRAFALEKRLKACVANSFLPSIGEPFTVTWPPGLAALRGREFDAAFTEIAKANAGARWSFDHAQWAMGIERPSELINVWDDYSIFDLVEHFDRPLLNICGEGELNTMKGYALADWASRQVDMMAEAPGYYETYMFSKEEGAATHCQMGGLRQGAAVTMAWLENILGSHSERAAPYVDKCRKVIPDGYVETFRDVFGPDVEPALQRILAKESGQPLAI